MTIHDDKSAARPEPDALLIEIADYALDYRVESELALDTARLCLMDSLACMYQALDHPECVKLLGPVVPGAVLPGGARVPGTHCELDPVQAAFNIGTLVRWLDFNDTWLAAEWGHPSDNLGAILAVADYASRTKQASRGAGTHAQRGSAPGAELRMDAVLAAMVKAHEIQGVLALENSFNRVGLDHVLLVRIASTAVACSLMSASHEQTVNAVSNAWLDGGALRTYRHAPNTGWRKSWAAGDAASRGVRHALMALTGEMGYPSALTAPKWGLCDVLLGGKPITRPRPFGSYVMENVLFKISYPAEFHAQTAVEAAMQLHPLVRDRLDEIAAVNIETQEPGVRIIDKTGPLANPADRDHCLQYMVAVPLVFGRLTADDYGDAVAADPRIDALRAKMQVRENPDFTRNYYDLDKRTIGNAVDVIFKDGSRTQRVAIETPIGHRERRCEGVPLLVEKFRKSVAPKLGVDRFARLESLCSDGARLAATPVDELMALLAAK